MLTSDELLVMRTCRDHAQAYCDFIDAWCEGSVLFPYSTLFHLLLNIANSGCALPWGVPKSNGITMPGMDDAVRMRIGHRIQEVVHPGCEALMEHYQGIVAIQADAAMLWDDLLDVYVELHDGLRLYALGTQECVEEAAFHWRFGYNYHLGDHLFDALKTVHNIRFQAMCD